VVLVLPDAVGARRWAQQAFPHSQITERFSLPRTLLLASDRPDDLHSKPVLAADEQAAAGKLCGYSCRFRNCFPLLTLS
jgi:hypothetical protein